MIVFGKRYPLGHSAEANTLAAYLNRNKLTEPLTGLDDCQARDEKALSFHFNTALSAVNLAKLQLLEQHQPDKAFVFSLSSYIRAAFNQKILRIFSGNLDLDLICPKVNAAFYNALSFGLPGP